MKKYRLLKDIPTPFGIRVAGGIFAKDEHGSFYCEDLGFDQTYIDVNPEFFEEITRWKPKDEDFYFFIDRRGGIQRDVFCNTSSDQEHYKFGNCFENREAAEAARDAIQKLLLNLHENE